MKLSRSFLRQALPFAEVYYNGKEVDMHGSEVCGLLDSDQSCEISIDSRTAMRGNMFVALQGKRSDGHTFLTDALMRGASCVMISNRHREKIKLIDDTPYSSVLIIVVPETIEALTLLAQYWRDQFDYPVVGITGSIGKTTTKEMTRTILANAGINALVSYKNQNTILGLCLNIAKMKPEHQVAIFELGIDAKGEMKTLVSLLKPTIALVTGIAHSHTSFLGSAEQIAEEKLQIFSHFKPHNIGIVLGDLPLLVDRYFPHPLVRFGKKTKNHVQARKIKVEQDVHGRYITQFVLKLYQYSLPIHLQGNHSGRVYNALGAASISYFLGIPPAGIVRGLDAFVSCEGRFEVKEMKDGRGVMINDCYNANPESTRAVLQAFHAMKSENPKIAILGDMLELGEKEIFWHRQMGRVLCRCMSINHLILVGSRARHIASTAPHTMKMTYVENWEQAREELARMLLVHKAFVLVKGSLGVGLGNLVQVFT